MTLICSQKKYGRNSKYLKNRINSTENITPEYKCITVLLDTSNNNIKSNSNNY